MDLEPTEANFRIMAQVTTDQAALWRRTTNSIDKAAAEAHNSDAAADLSRDPLTDIAGKDEVTEQQARIVDIIVLAALGQTIAEEEFQDYAQRLLTLYIDSDFATRLQGSVLKNQTLKDIEKEWSQGTDIDRVRDFFQQAKTSVERAAALCNIKISELPEF